MPRAWQDANWHVSGVINKFRVSAGEIVRRSLKKWYWSPRDSDIKIFATFRRSPFAAMHKTRRSQCCALFFFSFLFYQRPAGRSTRWESRSSRTPCAGRTTGPFPRASLGGHGWSRGGTDSQGGERQRRPDVTMTTTTARSDGATWTRLDYRPARCRSKLHLQTPVDHTFRIFVDVPRLDRHERPRTADKHSRSRDSSRRDRRPPRASVSDGTAGPPAMAITADGFAGVCATGRRRRSTLHPEEPTKFPPSVWWG